MTELFITPTDVLLFRDGRSFSAGTGDHLATGHFPPRPTALYGALRSAILSQADADFDAPDFGIAGTDAGRIAGTQTEVGDLAITHFALARRTRDAGGTNRGEGEGGIERLYPIPKDVLRRKEDDDKPYHASRFCPLRPKASPPGTTNLPGGLDLLWTGPETNVGDTDAAASTKSTPSADETPVYTGVTGYLPERAFHRLLAGDMKALRNAVSAEALYTTEPRTSVNINSDTHTASEGKLFTVQFVRVAPEVGFSVHLSSSRSLPLSSDGYLRLGGESRSAHYRVQPSSAGTSGGSPAMPGGSDTSSLAHRIADDNGRFKAVMTTPGVFSGGWRPDIVNDDLTGTLAGCNVTLQSAAVGSHVHVGGWDIAAGRPKQTARAVPVGSVYFFKLDDPSDADTLLENSAALSLAAAEADRKQGLAQAHIGTLLS